MSFLYSEFRKMCIKLVDIFVTERVDDLQVRVLILLVAYGATEIGNIRP